MVDLVTKSRAERAAALEDWADRFDPDDLMLAETSTLRAIVELVEQRDQVDVGLTAAVKAARDAGRSWSEIGAMLGVSKQAAQRTYGPLCAAS